MKLKTQEIVLFPVLGVILFVSKLLMEFLPNVHILAPLTIAYTVVFRRKAIIPVLIFAFLTGVYNGFTPWLIPYFYIWPILWGVTMLLPKDMPKKVAMITYMIAAGAHGFLYGTMYLPFQAIMFGFDFKQCIAWLSTGLPWDLVHGVSNVLVSTLTLPIISILKKCVKMSGI